MTATLTGSDATKALQLYTSLAARGASFDARKVARDIRTRSGRTRLAFALARKAGQAGQRVSFPRPRVRGFRVRRSRSVRTRGSTADPSEHHPDVAPRSEEGTARYRGGWGG